MSADARNKIAVFLIAAVTILLYFNSFGNGFIFDDAHTVQDNLYIKDSRYIPLFFQGYYTSVPIDKGMLRPFLLLTFHFNYLFSGLAPLGYHLINTLLHFLNSFLLFYLLALFVEKGYAVIPFGVRLLVTLLFTAHPIHTEAVSYISCRSDLLVTFLLMGAFILYLRKNNALCMFLYMLGLLTKETALVFPFLVLAYECILGDTQESSSKSRWQKTALLLSLFALSVTYWLYRMALFGQASHLLAPLHNPLRSYWQNILVQSTVTLFYLRLCIFPFPLTIHHALSHMNSLADPYVFISVLGLIAMALCIPALKKKRPLLSFGLAWYLICLIPKFYGVLNVVAAEHHFYLPSIGIFIMAAWLSVSFYKRYKPVYTAIAVIMIGIFSVMVWMRNFQWQDSVRLWKAALKVDPQSEIAWHNVGADYLDKKDFTNAQKCFQKSLELSTKGKVNVESRIGLAMVMAARRQFAEAEALLKETLALHPTYSGTYLFLGKLYKDAGELKKAEEAWMQGLRLDPGSSHMYVGLGVLYLEQEKLAQAKEQFQKALAANPDSGMAYFGLGQVYERIASFDQAIGAYEKAVRLNPGHAKTHYCLGTLYAKRNDTRAFWHLQEAVRLDPDFAEAHNNLAVFYASLNPPKLSHAREHAQKALKLGYAVDKRFLESIGLSGR